MRAEDRAAFTAFLQQSSPLLLRTAVRGGATGAGLAAGPPRPISITETPSPSPTAADGAIIPVAMRSKPVDLAGTDLQVRQPYRLANLRGAVVVVNALGSWCKPCAAQVDTLATLRQHLGYSSSVAILGLDERDTAEFVGPWLTQRNALYPVLDDPAGHLAGRLGFPDVLPATEVIDAQGRVAARLTGPATAAELTKVVDSLRTEAGIHTTDPAPHSGLVDEITHQENIAGVDTLVPDGRPVGARGRLLTAAQAAAANCGDCRPDELSYGLDHNLNHPRQVIPVWVLTYRGLQCPPATGGGALFSKPAAAPASPPSPAHDCESVEIVDARTGRGYGTEIGEAPLERQ